MCLRWRVLASLFRADELSATPEEVDQAYPARGKLGFRGIGVSSKSGRDYYFKTRAGDLILVAIREAGFVVTTDMRTPDKLWTGRP